MRWKFKSVLFTVDDSDGGLVDVQHDEVVVAKNRTSNRVREDDHDMGKPMRAVSLGKKAPKPFTDLLL